MPEMVPAKMSVTKELVADILHLMPVTNFVNFFFKLSLYIVDWELKANVWHASTIITLTAGNWQLAECQDEYIHNRCKSENNAKPYSHVLRIWLG